MSKLKDFLTDLQVKHKISTKKGKTILQLEEEHIPTVKILLGRQFQDLDLSIEVLPKEVVKPVKFIEPKPDFYIKTPRSPSFLHMFFRRIWFAIKPLFGK